MCKAVKPSVGVRVGCGNTRDGRGRRGGCRSHAGKAGGPSGSALEEPARGPRGRRQVWPCVGPCLGAPRSVGSAPSVFSRCTLCRAVRVMETQARGAHGGTEGLEQTQKQKGTARDTGHMHQ